MGCNDGLHRQLAYQPAENADDEAVFVVRGIVQLDVELWTCESNATRDAKKAMRETRSGVEQTRHKWRHTRTLATLNTVGAEWHAFLCQMQEKGASNTLKVEGGISGKLLASSEKIPDG